MYLLEAFMKDAVHVDFDSEILYGSDQAYISYPIRFATVTFQLMATNALSQIADRVRKDIGFAPMHPMDEYTDETCDNEGRYDFNMGLNLFTEKHTDTCLTFTVVNSDSPDNEATYNIDLSPDEQAAIYNRLNEQCKERLGKSCEELLREAEKQMMESAEYERLHPYRFSPSEKEDET